MFSRATSYAIRAMTYLAHQPAGRLSRAKEISDAEDIPMPFLWKILKKLTNRKLIRSFKGMRGGYELACTADEINLHDIIESMEDSNITDGCVLGLPECSDEQPCPLHREWRVIKTDILQMFDNVTLATLVAATKGSEHRPPSP